VIRSIIRSAFLLAVVLAAPVASADDPPPTPQQMEQAKKAFAEGKKLHDAGKLPESIEKFKESYKLSKNPLLLYNIGITMEEAQMEDLALFYFRKFLKEAPQDAAQRQTVTEHVAALEKKFNPNGTGEPATTTPPTTTAPATAKQEPKAPVQIKPPGTYTADDFQHQLIDVAPPAKPLDVTAFVPEDSGFTVTLYYRTAGEGKFASREMKWRYKELVGRIPAPKMIGNAVQYYIEVKDTTGAVVTRSGKSTSPNLVNLESGAAPRFYPDVSDEGDAKLSESDIRARDIDDDDPLNKNKKKKSTKKATASSDDEPGLTHPESSKPGNGFRDVGSSKFKYTKWGSTIAAGTLLGASVLLYVQANNFAKSLEDESTKCGAPPCAPFDSFNQDLENGGKARQKWANVSLGVGVGAAVIASYFWYKDLTAKKRGERKVAKQSKSNDTSASWVITPSVGGNDNGSFVGAAAAARF
jgi:hypothetical protein